jgi:hypothetical protein
MYPVAGGRNSILAGFQTPVLGSSNTAYTTPSAFSFTNSWFHFQNFKMYFEIDLHLLIIELPSLRRLLHSAKFRTKHEDDHKTPAGHCTGYLQ